MQFIPKERIVIIMKNKVLVKDLYRNTNNYTNQTVTVSGWVRTIRDSKSFGFIELNDGSFFF